VNAIITESNELAETSVDAESEGLEAPRADLVLTPEIIERILWGWVDAQR
jgi:hypothetical protein